MAAIDTTELKSLLDRHDDVVVVNTLPPSAFEETMLPGAVNVPQDQEDFVDRMTELAGGKDKTIVVYCASVDCDSSTDAAKKLDHAGFTNVFDYRGGAKAWKEHSADAVR